MAKNLTRGTTALVRFSRVVDGDTIRIFPTPQSEKDESVRILYLDTEESFSAGGKPVTPWGKEAKKEAERFFSDAKEVTIEFPGNDSVTTALDRYRGNFGRLLVLVYYNGIDFQQHMIRNGYSPYFTKYGNAVFSSHHRRYTLAEKQAQLEGIGVWDQIGVNGSVRRDYPKLSAWWKLRASLIDEYRKIRAADGSVYNTRLDYEELFKKAQTGDQIITVFTEVRDLRRVNRDAAIVSIGSRSKPFNIYIPDVDTDKGDKIVKLLLTRYISKDETDLKGNYCYITGLLNTFRNNPQLVVTNAEDITDTFETSVQKVGIENGDAVDNMNVGNGRLQVDIIAALPNPEGSDYGSETVTIRAGKENGQTVSLEGWTIQDAIGSKFVMSGSLKPGEERVIDLPARSVTLNNRGDEIRIVDESGKIVSMVSYTAADVKSGVPVIF